MEEEGSAPSVSSEIMQRFPQLIASVGVASAMEGDMNFSSSLGWWTAGWKLLIAMGAYEAIKYGKRTSVGENAGRFARIGAQFRGRTLATHIMEKGFAAYAIHEALGATIYRDQPVDMRSVLYTTLGMYGIKILGKIRN